MTHRSQAHNSKSLSLINSRLGYISHADTFKFRKTALEKAMQKTGLKDFNLEEERFYYWKTLKTNKDYSSIKIRKRLSK